MSLPNKYNPELTPSYGSNAERVREMIFPIANKDGAPINIYYWASTPKWDYSKANFNHRDVTRNFGRQEYTQIAVTPLLFSAISFFGGYPERMFSAKVGLGVGLAVGYIFAWTTSAAKLYEKLAIEHPYPYPARPFPPAETNYRKTFIMREKPSFREESQTQD
eukprot:TRINITY_DN1306_c0_g1_i1.p2 TRINITY_DN1306_c0_g1~~TRINITY_DN1306_c0_g1_i1.p2  ORF type:complete len:163 (-),score=18.64 TRINITY_DN1306_c0_g1_i1:57-545(-)